MEHDKTTFKQAFIHLYFLMLSADKVADIEEIKLGSKIIKLEKLDKKEVMKGIDVLSSKPREDVFEQGLTHLRSLNRENQLKCLAYIKLMAEADGAIDDSENELLYELGTRELNISAEQISEKEREVQRAISSMKN